MSIRSESQSSVTPLIVCGKGRSGTRNTANVFNAHGAVKLYGEISGTALQRLFALLAANDALSDHRLAAWQTKKLTYIFDSFRGLSSGQARRRPNSQHRLIGFKCPGVEMFFAQFEEHFASCGVAPRYVYCVRDPVDCWASNRSMAWHRHYDVSRFIEQYAQSLRQLTEMRKAVAGRVSVMNLDDLIARDNPAEYYAETLFSPLGLAMSERFCEEVRTIDNTNSTLDRTGAPRPPAPPEDAAAIRKDPEIRRLRALNGFAPG